MTSTRVFPLRRFKSVSGDIYLGRVYDEAVDYISMCDYQVWYAGNYQTHYKPTNSLDSVGFTRDVELPA